MSRTAVFVLLIVAACLSTAHPQTTLPAANIGEFRLNAVGAPRGGSTYLRCGVPLRSDTSVLDPADLTVTTVEGRPIPARIRATSRRNGTPDDPKAPIRWVLIEMAAPKVLPATFFLRSGRSTLKHVESDIADEQSRLLVGDIEIFWNSSARDLGQKINWQGKKVATAPFFRLLVDDENGAPIEAPPWHVEVDAGDTAAGLTAKTTVLDLDVTLRLHLVSGASEMVGDLTITNPGPYGHMDSASKHVYFKRFGLTLPAPERSETAAAGGRRVRLGEQPIALITQHEWSATRQLPAESLPFEIWHGDQRIASGERLPGVASIGRDDLSLTYAVERFWQCAPKALLAGADGAVLDIFPIGGHGPEYGGVYGEPTKPKSVDPKSKESYRFEGARSYTTRFHISFDDDDVSKAEARWRNEVDRPISAVPLDMEYGSASPIAFPTAVRGATDDVGVGRFETMMQVLIDDQAADPVVPLGKIGLPAFIDRGGTYGQQSFYGWFNFGDIAWGDGYSSLHYDWPFVMLLNYLRTGDPRFFERGDQMSQHRRDIDQDHDRTSTHNLRGGQFYEKGYWHGNYYHPSPSHTWLGGPILHYLLTGDEGSLEAAHLGAAFLRRQRLDKWDGMWGVRIPGWTADNLALYGFIFGKKGDLDHARDIIRNFERIETTKYGKKGFVINEAMNPRSEQPWMLNIMFNGIARYALVTGSKEFDPVMRRMLDHFRNECILGVPDRPLLSYRYVSPELKKEPSIHLSWSMAASFAWAYVVLADPKDRALGRELFGGAARYPQEWQDGSMSPIAFRMMNYPNSESKIFSNIGLWGSVVLGLFE